jgi:hypothetical protein
MGQINSIINRLKNCIKRIDWIGYLEIGKCKFRENLFCFFHAYKDLPNCSTSDKPDKIMHSPKFAQRVISQHRMNTRQTLNIFKPNIMIFKQLNRLQQIDQLIRQKRTGSPSELAKKLGVSKRQLYYWLDDLKDLGLEIKYSRNLGSFVYLKQYLINISLDIKELKESELTYTNAGGIFFQKKYNSEIKLH